ncbi:MAG: cytochrome c [Vicinamibacterales bacterium]
MTHLRFRLLGGTALVWVVVTAMARQEPAAPSVLSGVFTKEQATRGEKLYAANCVRCHGETLGGIEQAPPLAGPEFSGAWEGKPLSALVTKIKGMPPDEQSTLSRTEIVELLSYLLSAGGLPAGATPLAEETSVLAKVLFHAPSVPAR